MKSDLLPVETIPAPDTDKITETIRLGQSYMDTHIPTQTSLARLFSQQIRYLSPLLFAVQISVLFFVMLATHGRSLNPQRVADLLVILSPAVSLFAVPELLKDVHFQMSELEASCKNRGSTVLLLRLLGVSGLNLIVLILVAGLLANASGQNFFLFLVCALLPYHSSVFLSLFLARLLRLKNRGGTLILSLTSTGVCMAVFSATPLLERITLPILLIAFFVSALLLAIQFAQIFADSRKGEMLLWN